MKIALYEPCDENYEHRIFYPLGLGYLSSYLKKFLPDVEVKIFKTFKRLLDYSPDLAGISCLTPSYFKAFEASDVIKRELGCPVVWGGSHITNMPESIPESCDIGVIGEGEETFLNIVRIYLKKKNIGEPDFTDVPGVVIKKGDKIIKTPPAEFIEPVDEIPFPERNWDEEAFGGGWSFSSRGCPYRCSFCFSANFWNKYRAHSPKYVVDELELLLRVKTPLLNHHGFMDDLLSAIPARVKEIGNLIKERFSQPITFTATVRPNLATEELAEALKDMGAKYLHLGLESGSDRVLTYLKQEKCSVLQNQKALDVLSIYDFYTIGSFIIGAPGETREDLDMTYSFITQNLKSGKLKNFFVSPLMAFPGTKVWNDAVLADILNPQNIEWECLDIDLHNFRKDRYILLNPQMEREEFFRYYDKFKELEV